MSLYAIGDIHGCYSQLQRLLDKLAFDPAQDELWFVGDLVNRGKDSLSTLRFIKQLGNRAHCVLGNHDFHLMRFAAGLSQVKDIGMNEILNAPDCDELLDWLYQRPLAIVDKTHSLILVHAGVFPQWNIQTLETLAEEVSEQIRNEDKRYDFLSDLYGDQPEIWNDHLTGMDRLRIAVNIMTRMRYLGVDDMHIDFSESGTPADAPAGIKPWYEFNNQALQGTTILFGHWASHGFKRMDGFISLDSGCVWGNQLTAICLDKDNEKVFQVDYD